MDEIESENPTKRFQFSVTDMVIVSGMSFVGLVLLGPVVTCLGNPSTVVRFVSMLGIIAASLLGAYFGLPQEKSSLPKQYYMLGGIVFGWIVFTMLLFAIGPVFMH